jgi:hypothetical protein
VRLYHFTAEHLLDRIKREGLTMGGVVVSLFPPKIKNGYRWLTLNPEFSQSWNAQFLVKYDRAAIRIEIEVPLTSPRLMKWVPRGRELTTIQTYEDLNRFGDPENWFVWKGDIPPTWFVGVATRQQNI